MSKTIWVGELEGKVLIYDPEIQLPDCHHLFLWEPATGEMGKYIANLIRKKIRPHANSSEIAIHVASYRRWHENEGIAWLNQQTTYYDSFRETYTLQKEAERLANLPLEEKHKLRLERLGREYQGVRSAARDTRHRRIVHCYACQQELDNSIDIECVACGWILCSCGACGCGFEGLA
jgi:hypothetical protein